MATSENKITYSCDGEADQFDFAFKIFQTADIAVILKNITTGTETILTEITDYIVSAPNNNYNRGGKVTTTQTYSDNYEITLIRSVEITQQIEYPEGSAFPAKAHENALDKLTMVCQQIWEKVLRTLSFPITDEAVPQIPSSVDRAGKYLAFDGSGAPIATAGPRGDSDIPVSSYAETLLDDPDAETARATLQAAADDEVVKLETDQTITGAKTFSANINMADNRITALGDPDDPADAANKSYVDNAIDAETQRADSRIDSALLNIMLNAFRLAVAAGMSVLLMDDGISDEFGDETGIATADCSGQQYYSLGRYYSNTDTQINVATTGSNIGDMDTRLSAAFDGNTNQGYTVGAYHTAATTSRWAGKDWGSGVTKRIRRAKVYASNNAGFTSAAGSVTITLQGSDDSGFSAPVNLGSQVTANTNSAVVEILSNSPQAAYRYHRVLLQAASGNFGFAEVELFESSSDNVTLVSDSWTADSQPGQARIIFLRQDCDEVVVNTDIKAYVSRDDGTSWSEVELADDGSYDADIKICSGSVSISGEPAGTDMRYKIVTDNNKIMNIHGVALLWL